MHPQLSHSIHLTVEDDNHQKEILGQTLISVPKQSRYHQLDQNSMDSCVFEPQRLDYHFEVTDDTDSSMHHGYY